MHRFQLQLDAGRESVGGVVEDDHESIAQEARQAPFVSAGHHRDTVGVTLDEFEPGHFAVFVEQLGQSDGSFVELERSVIGVTHAEVGAHLLDRWQLPTSIVEAVAFHHTPGDSCMARYAPLTAVHVAEVFHDAYGADGVERRQQIDMEYLERIGLADRLDTWYEACEIAEI